MRLIVQLLFVAALALAIGLGSVYYATHAQLSFITVKNGSWYAYPNIGKPDIDAYTLAYLSISGEIPLAVVDGIAFQSTTDDTGRTLDARCDYLITGNLDAVPVWTLSLTDTQGRDIFNPARRYAFTSQEILRSANGEIRALVSASPKGKDWLPAPDKGAFTLHLRFYDVAINAFAENRSRTPLPRIERRSCE